MSGTPIGSEVRVRIEKAVAGGRMLARADGAVVLVAGALPGEVVDVQIERQQHGTLWARAARVVEPSPERVGEYDSCGGNVLAHARYELQLALKQQIIQDAFARVARHPIEPPPAIASPIDGHRMRARLHVEQGRAGFFLEGTHRLCDVAATRQLRPDTLAALDACVEILGPADVIAIDVAENREASERVAHVELRRGADLSAFPEAAVPGFSGLSLSVEGAPRVRVLSGIDRVTDRFATAKVEWALGRTGRAFFQGNRFLLEPLVHHVVQALAPGAVTDLYAGVGLFSIAAAAHGRAPVMAVEGDAVSAADLRRNTAEWRGLVQPRHASVEEYLRDRRLVRPQTLVLDPPRTGLSRRALEAVVALKTPRIVYVSCDVPTLARDTRALIDSGYRLSGLTAFDLFPQTAHIETVAVFDL